MGYCPQFDALLPSLTVREHMELYAALRGYSGEDAVSAAVNSRIKAFGLGEFPNRLATTLSGGAKRKLCVAIATLGKPDVLLADEASTGMDPAARRGMRTALQALSE